MDLPDVNVWLALTFESHAHHRVARAWFDRAETESCAFCRLTQQAFLRLASNPSVFGEDAVTLARAWRLYDQLQGDPRVDYVEEPTGMEQAWRGFSTGQTYSPKVWSDAYLAGFAKTSGHRLVTLDRDFLGFKGLRCLILDPKSSCP